MRERKKILIINYTQFGYHIDSTMYSKYADKDRFDLHYFCFVSGLEKVNIEGVTVKYVTLLPGRALSYIKFFIALKEYILAEKFNLIFHIDARFTLIIRLMNIFERMVLDIRTGNLSDNRFIRLLKNFSIRLSSMFYRQISIITESLRKELKIPGRKVTIIPLGGELQKCVTKSFSNLKLLYVGTLEKRNINQTISGLALFSTKYPAAVVSYDIIGFGKEGTEKKISDLIRFTDMDKKIVFHGRKKHSDIIPFLERCNVGLVYVPSKGYYQFQSSTKFYEYVLAGMPVIATDTYENRIAIREGSGFICKDDPASFAEALEKIYTKRESFDPQRIRSMYLSDQWSVIVKGKWEPFILENCRLIFAGQKFKAYFILNQTT